MRALRGAKTDRIDAARIAEYLQHGLLRASFVPPRPIRQLRDLTRMRVQLQHDRNRIINRTARLLETANVKLGSVASNIVGKSGGAMLEPMAAGVSQPERLAELACGSSQEKKAQLALALEGRFQDHFRWLLRGLLQELTRLDAQIREVEQRLENQMHEHADLIERLCTMPGVNRVNGLGSHLRAGREYGAVCRCRARRQLGGLMSWQQRKLQQAPVGRHTQSRAPHAKATVICGAFWCRAPGR